MNKPGDRTQVASFRLSADLVAALRQRADENGESLSDALRRGVLMIIGKCPTCGQDAPPGPPLSRERGSKP